MPPVSPRRPMYSMIRASIAVLPVRSPMPSTEPFTAEQPYSQAATELLSAR